MNRLLEPRTRTVGTPTHPRRIARPVTRRYARWLVALALGAGLAGCGFLKPAKSSTRHFVLAPLPAAGPVSAPTHALALGVGQVRLPSYLFDTSLAVRRGTNEIEYLRSVLWAERLDGGFQRVLAANLSVLLSTEKIPLSTWLPGEVSAEVYVAIEQFDVDTTGQGMLVARWRILSPGSEKVLRAGGCRLSRQGPPPDTSAAGAVATLSDLAAEFSRRLAQTLRETLAHPAASPPP